MPGDASVAFRDCICAVKYSTNPIGEIRESILEMIENVGIRNWDQMEDLIYCYVALNSTEVHNFIEDAFLSLCFTT
ncbi:transcription repressor ofp14 [Phtheirospermum japonicum]|uniref:Transcription repressor n=1 Tax=Phtheirospermum japonicum TaxID=374723 RepID=A0A830CE66_9LAMI|nr:transcription repressor ofp14 [Phtheirospermum japonicum]